MIQAILFDMDGVIFDTEILYKKYNFKVAKEQGLLYTNALHEQLYGVNAEKCKMILENHYGPEFDYALFSQTVHCQVFDHMETNGIGLKEGVLELLDFLEQNHYPKAIASSSNVAIIQHHLALSGLEGRFDSIIGGNMVKNSKPAPDIFITAAHALEVSPQACAAFEDSFNGVRSASSAGCITVMVPDMQQPTEEIRKLAHVVLPSLAQAPDYLSSFPRRIYLSNAAL